MRAAFTPDQARRRFAEETDASADLGRASDAAERMARIHAEHQAALSRLQASEGRSLLQAEHEEIKSAET